MQVYTCRYMKLTDVFVMFISYYISMSFCSMCNILYFKVKITLFSKDLVSETDSSY